MEEAIESIKEWMQQQSQQNQAASSHGPTFLGIPVDLILIMGLVTTMTLVARGIIRVVRKRRADDRHASWTGRIVKRFDINYRFLEKCSIHVLTFGSAIVPQLGLKLLVTALVLVALMGFTLLLSALEERQASSKTLEKEAELEAEITGLKADLSVAQIESEKLRNRVTTAQENSKLNHIKRIENRLMHSAKLRNHQRATVWALVRDSSGDPSEFRVIARHALDSSRQSRGKGRAPVGRGVCHAIQAHDKKDFCWHLYPQSWEGNPNDAFTDYEVQQSCAAFGLSVAEFNNIEMKCRTIGGHSIRKGTTLLAVVVVESLLGHDNGVLNKSSHIRLDGDIQEEIRDYCARYVEPRPGLKEESELEWLKS